MMCKVGPLIHFWWEGSMVQLLWKTLWQFLKQLNIDLLCDPAIPLLAIHAGERKTSVDTKKLHTKLHSRFICQGQSLENPRMYQNHFDPFRQ